MIYTESGEEVALARLREAPSFWYVASPYSRYPGGIEAAFADIAGYTARMVEAGLAVFSPIAHSHPVAIQGGLDPLDHSVWMPLDEPMMRAAHGIIVVQMAGWRESYGVGVEINAFRAAGKPVLFMPVWGVR
jgi:hypothetical protein